MAPARNNTALLVVAIGFVVLLLNSGSRFSMGLMLKPMVEDLDWTRSTLSLAVTVFMVVTALGLPVVGRLVDRFGPKQVLVLSTLLTGVSLGLMTFMRTPAEALILYGVVFGFASAGTSVTPIGVMISRWFPERVGMANSIAISGMGVGQLVVILALAAWFDQLGWRGAFFALGIGNLLFVLPLALVRLPAAPAAAAAESTAQSPPTPDDGAAALPVTPPLRSRRYWTLLAIYAICGFQDFFVATHVVAFATDQGLGVTFSGNLLAFMGLSGLVGVLLTGHLSDRWGAAWPTGFCFVLRTAIFVLVLASPSVPAIAAFALLYGSTFWITAPLTVVFVRDTFGMTRLGVLTGVVTMVHHGAGGLGAFVGAALFDLQGSYASAFALLLAMSVVAAGLTFTLRSRVR